MNDVYAILIERKAQHYRKYMLVRENGETLLHFPMIKKVTRTPHKKTITKVLKARYGLENVDPIRISITGYQETGVPYFMIPIYEVKTESLPSSLTSNGSIAWMSEDDIHSHISQMSFLMQYAIVPCLDEKGAWPA